MQPSAEGMSHHHCACANHTMHLPDTQTDLPTLSLDEMMGWHDVLVWACYRSSSGRVLGVIALCVCVCVLDTRAFVPNNTHSTPFSLEAGAPDTQTHHAVGVCAHTNNADADLCALLDLGGGIHRHECVAVDGAVLVLLWDQLQKHTSCRQVHMVEFRRGGATKRGRHSAQTHKGRQSGLAASCDKDSHQQGTANVLLCCAFTCTTD